MKRTRVRVYSKSKLRLTDSVIRKDVTKPTLPTIFVWVRKNLFPTTIFYFVTVRVLFQYLCMMSSALQLWLHFAGWPQCQNSAYGRCSENVQNRLQNLSSQFIILQEHGWIKTICWSQMYKCSYLLVKHDINELVNRWTACVFEVTLLFNSYNLTVTQTDSSGRGSQCNHVKQEIINLITCYFLSSCQNKLLFKSKE